jgi:hypothetical protein
MGESDQLLDRRGEVAPYHMRLDWLMWFEAMAPSPHSGNDPIARDGGLGPRHAVGNGVPLQRLESGLAARRHNQLRIVVQKKEEIHVTRNQLELAFRSPEPRPVRSTIRHTKAYASASRSASMASASRREALSPRRRPQSGRSPAPRSRAGRPTAARTGPGQRSTASRGVKLPEVAARRRNIPRRRLRPTVFW